MQIHSNEISITYSNSQTITNFHQDGKNSSISIPTDLSFLHAIKIRSVLWHIHILILNAFPSFDIQVLYFEEETQKFSFSLCLARSIAFPFILQLNGDLKGIGVECEKISCFCISNLERLIEDLSRLFGQITLEYSSVAKAIQTIDERLFSRKVGGELERCILSNGNACFNLSFFKNGFQLTSNIEFLKEWELNGDISCDKLDEFISWCSSRLTGCIRRKFLCEICCCPIQKLEELFQCPNEKCAKAFHVKCISRWFKSTSVLRYNVVQGECLNCSHAVTISKE
jgi:hypothetical protein